MNMEEKKYKPLKDNGIQKEWELVHEERKNLANMQLQLAEEKIKLDEELKVLAEEKGKAIQSNIVERNNFKDMWDKERESMDKTRDRMRDKILSLNLENDKLLRENESLKKRIHEFLGAQNTPDKPAADNPVMKRLLTKQDSVLSLFFDGVVAEPSNEGTAGMELWNPFEVHAPIKKGPADVTIFARQSIVVLFDGRRIKESEYDEKKIILCQKTIRRWLRRKKQELEKIPKQLLQKRKQILQELCDSEKKYIDELQICVNNYLEPLRLEAEESDEILTTAEHDTLFSNIEILLSLSMEFLRGLLLKLDEFNTHDALGDYFVTWAPVMKLYSAYLRNYENSCKLMTDLLQREDRAFLQKVEQLETKSSSFVTLSDFLAKPIHRLPEYPEYLKRLLEDTNETHADHDALHEALSKVRQVIQVINDKQREEKNAKQVLEVYDKLIGFNKKKSGAPARRYIREGTWIYILSAKRRTGEKKPRLFI
eukprot:TRINITY_DN22060_c0_g1_i1.p1 TRINITY_DN22060_c0_g1~~TRINITY_DN22060_c0_g1_i1.p1  ORF type:complete len:496 (-),score=110.18 TRINITY_DN22060_c0_g1_i1:337-1782(-)